MVRPFAPAERIIGRLTCSYKIVLTAMMFLIPTGYLTWFGESPTQHNIQQHDCELHGLEYLLAVPWATSRFSV